MKNLLCTFLIVIGLLGCTKVCEIAKSSASSVVPKIAEKWACAHQDVMKKDIEEIVAGSFVCESKQKTGVVGNLVCPVLVEFLRGQLSNTVPASWGCNPSLVGSDAASGISALCSSALPF